MSFKSYTERFKAKKQHLRMLEVIMSSMAYKISTIPLCLTITLISTSFFYKKIFL